MRSITSAAAKKACLRMNNGEGEKFKRYPDVNRGKKYSIRATSSYYCTFYSTKHFPPLLSFLAEIKTPVFWIAGSQDRLTDVFQTAFLFKKIGSKKKKYSELPGDHISVLTRHSNKIVDWLKSL